MEHEGDGDTSCNWRTWNDPQKLSKRVEQSKIGGRDKIIQITALLSSWRPEETCCHSNSSGKPSAKADVKNSRGIIIIIICQRISVGYVETEETVNHIISKCIKSIQKEQCSWYNLVWKLIYWELGKRFRFNHSNNCSIHKGESAVEHETLKIF